MSPLVYLTLFRLYPKSGCLLQVFGTAVPSLYSVLLPIYQMSVSQQILRDDHHEARAQDIVFRRPTNASGLQPLVPPGNCSLRGFLDSCHSSRHLWHALAY